MEGRYYTCVGSIADIGPKKFVLFVPFASMINL
jgi:hypothetical protein